MSKKQFTLIINHFEKEHFGKDPFLVPYYIQFLYKVNVTIVYPQTLLNEDLPKTHRGITLHPIKHTEGKSLNKYFLRVAWYLLKNAKQIDILMTFHIFMKTGRIALLYKLLNRKGKSYVKLDIPIYVIDRISDFFNDNSLNRK